MSRPRMLKPGILGRLAQKILPRSWLVNVPYLSAYPSTDPRRLLLEGWQPLNATADQTLGWNLTVLIAQCRMLERGNAVARGIVEGWKADIVGTGITIEPDTGDDGLNKIVRLEWDHWCEHASADGRTLWEIQAQSIAEWCTAGANLWRQVIIPDRLKDGNLPICFSPLEVEWLTLYPLEHLAIAEGNSFVRGKEMDRFGRPISYHIMDYNALNTLGLGTGYGGPGERVAASEIIHGYEQRRPRQSHGEPILAAAIERLKQTEQLVDIELKASRVTASPAIAITSQYQQDVQVNGDPVNDLPAGAIGRFQPGEEINVVENKRPTQLIKPFREMLRGDEAVATRSSQIWLDRNMGNSTYMNSRMDELITDRVRRPMQDSFARFTASEPYLRVLPYILLKYGKAIPSNPAAWLRMQRHKVLPDRPKYVDPNKDSAASKFMIDNELSTQEIECAARGNDWRKIQVQREIENEVQDAAVIKRVAAMQAGIMKAGLDGVLTWAQVLASGGATSSPGAFLEAIAPPEAPEPAAAQGDA